LLLGSVFVVAGRVNGANGGAVPMMASR